MSAAPVLTAPNLWPVDVRCGCRHRLPVRIERTTAGLLRTLLEATSGLDGGLVLATYRCSDCKAVVPLTLADLRLVV